MASAFDAVPVDAIPLKRQSSMEIPVMDESDILQITALGAGNEVGRSCLVVQYKNKTVMLDVGIHPAYDGIAGLPFFDEVDLSTIDVCLVTHFHLDHAAGLPYLTEKTDFQGKVYMTHATKAIYKWMLTDYVKVSNVSREDMLFDERELLLSYDKIETVDFHQETEVEGIKFTAFNAGHVLGAAMFLIEIAGVKIFYTGDYSREEDRHLMAAEKPPVTPDVLICESTYGVQSHEPRLEREARFTTLVNDIVKRGGRCLIPVFALGRAQELLLILDEYWSSRPELDAIPIYYASSLAKKCMAVYQTFINTMNERIRKQFTVSNPFVFKHISNLRNMDNFDDNGPCVMMASPGMLQNGLSRELFERWCPDTKNGVIITGYSIDGTLAKHILSEPSEIQSMAGAKLPLRMSVDYISFSAHVDFTQNSQFIEEVDAPNLVLVHGDANAMHRLRNAMESRYKERNKPVNIYTPRNCETVQLHFRGEKRAKTVGKLAEKMPIEDQLISGVMVAKDYQYSIMASRDLEEFSGLSTSRIRQRMSIPCRATLSLVRYQLQQMYGAIDESRLNLESANNDWSKPATVKYTIMNAVDLIPGPDSGTMTLEWAASPVNDMVADSIVALLLGVVDTSPASVKLAGQSGSCCSSPQASSITEMDVKEEAEEKEEEEALKQTIKTEIKDDENADLAAAKKEAKAEATDAANGLNAIASKARRSGGDSIDTAGWATFLREQFDNVEIKSHPSRIRIAIDDVSAEINLTNLCISTTSLEFRKRLEPVVQRIALTLQPIE